MSTTILGTVSKVAHEGSTVRVSVRQVNAESPAWFEIAPGSILGDVIGEPGYRQKVHAFRLNRAGRISQLLED